MYERVWPAIHCMYQSSILLCLSQEKKWLKCILTSASTGCGRRGSTRSLWTMKICCDPETLRAWVLADGAPLPPVKHHIPPALMKENRNWISCHWNLRVGYHVFQVFTRDPEPWARQMGSALKTEKRGHAPRTAFHVRVSKVKSLLGGSVEEWRMTVQCFLCHISISWRLSIS